jgi:TolA-binding protein
MHLWTFPLRAARAGLVLAACTIASVAAAGGQPTAEDQKQLKLAQDDLNNKHYPMAAQRFRALAGKFPEARFFLAVCLVDGHDKDNIGALKMLDSLKGDEKNIDHLEVSYYRALALRGHGASAMLLATQQPKDEAKHRAKAAEYFGQAAEEFARARDAFLKRAGAAAADAKPQPPDFERGLQAACDRLEMLCRLAKYKEAAEESKKFLAERGWARSQHHSRGVYYHGFAAFMLKDYAAAEKSLSMLAPYTDVRFGNHARYLLARVYHLADERTEAALHYEGVINDYNREKKEAQALLQKNEVINRDPWDKLRCEALVRNPNPPDHVVRAIYYSAVLLMEVGRFAEAKDRFGQFAKAPPGYPLTNEAQLRLGICQVQLKEAQAAQATLQPLIEREKALADQTLLWLARAAVLLVPEPNQKAAHDKAVAHAIGLYQQAAQRAEQLTDPGAKLRQGEILLELAEVQMRFGKPADAAATCQQIADKKLLPERAEDVSQRLIAAWHLAGDYDRSDAECRRFLNTYADSALKPAVLFRFAENSYFRTLAATSKLQDPKELAALRAETVKRYGELIASYPDFPRTQNARYAMALMHYQQGELAKAQALFEAIPGPDRTGELALTSYLLADCILRQVPSGVPEDALAAGKMEASLKQAAELLDAFAAGPQVPQTPEALMRLGQCLQRLASLQGQPTERNKVYQEARQAFEKVLAGPYAGHPLQAQALMERARCRVLYGGDIVKSTTELKAFANDPLRLKPCAPVAVVQAAVWLRGQNKNGEALALLDKFHGDYSNRKDADPVLLGLVAYQHGLAQRDAGQPALAKVSLAAAARLLADQAEGADAAMRLALIHKDEAAKLAEQASRLAATDPVKAHNLKEDARKAQIQAGALLDAQAEKIKGKPAQADVRARILYEAAWLYRDLGEQEIADAKAKLLDALAKKLGDKVKKLPPPVIVPPRQVSEARARDRYQQLIDDFADSALALDARYELAELHAQRGEYDEAIKQLVEALDREPSPELTEKVRFLLGCCHAAKGNAKAAVAQFDVVGQAVKSHLAAQAKLRAAEVFLKEKDHAEAIKRFAFFRDTPQYQQLPGLSDRALLGLGHAHAALGRWDAARQAHELLLNRHPGSKWTQEAQYGVGWAREQQGQLDQALAAYNQAAGGPLSQTAALAQLRVGVCYAGQKKFKEAADAFLAVSAKFGFDEWAALALLEAADAYGELKQVNEQAQVLNRVIREYPKTAWAKEAQKRLDKMK